MRYWWTSGLFVLLMVGMTSTALAGAEDGDVEFDELEVEMNGNDQLRITYEVDRQTWKWMKNNGVEPNLSVWEDDHHDSGPPRYAWGHALSSRSGSYTLPQALRVTGGDRVEIGVTGYSGTWRIRSIERGAIAGPRLIFTAHGDGDFEVSARANRRCRLGGGHDDGGKDDGDDSDDEHDDDHGDHDDGQDDGHDDGQDDGHDHHHGDSSDDEEDSDDDEQKVPDGWKAATIKACKQHVKYDSNVEDCTDLALDLEPRWASASVKACGQSVKYASNLTDCLEIAKRHVTHHPGEAVSACSEVVKYESNVLECFEMTTTYQSTPGPILRACKTAVHYDSNVEDCIEMGQSLDADEGPGLIRACAGRSWESCVEKAAGID